MNGHSLSPQSEGSWSPKNAQRLAYLEARVAELSKAEVSNQERIARLEAKVGKGGADAEVAGTISNPDDEVDDEESGFSGGSTSEGSGSGDEFRLVSHDSLSREQLAEDYEFTPSAWDAVVCFGHPAVGLGGSILLGLLVISNMAIQIIFCNVVRTAFTSNPYGQGILEALHWWRTGVAHSVDQVDLVSETSLASRVCNFDDALATSGSQKTVASDVDDYGWHLSSPGPIMCMLALGCWFIIVTAEISKILRLFVAILRVPRGKTRFVEDSEGSIQIKSLSCFRLSAIVFVMLARLAIALFLGWFGVDYLVYTSTAQDLLLNAVALQFVFEVDELLFEPFAPARVHHLIARLKPLPVKPAPMWKGADLRATLMFVAPFLLTFFAVYGKMSPAVHARKEAWDQICGGDKLFAVATDARGRVHWSHTSTYETYDWSHEGYVREAVQSIIANSTSPNSSMALYTPTLYGLVDNVRKQTVAESGKEFQCVDFDKVHVDHNDWDTMGRPILQWFTRNASIESCADVASYCEDVGLPGVRARQWCPDTCGCASGSSGLLLDSPEVGCPTACGQRYRSITDGVQCAPVTGLVNSTGWQNYVRGVVTLFSQRGYEVPELVALAAEMETQGCQAVLEAGEMGAALCIGSVDIENGAGKKNFRSARPLCPVVCGCDGSGLPGNKKPKRHHVDFTPGSNNALRISGACEQQVELDYKVFKLRGTTQSGSPLYRTDNGIYLYYGPDCTGLGSATRWIISPIPCNDGYFDAYVASDDPVSPPLSQEWTMNCANTSGWRPVQLNVTQDRQSDQAIRLW